MLISEHLLIFELFSLFTVTIKVQVYRLCFPPKLNWKDGAEQVVLKCILVGMHLSPRLMCQEILEWFFKVSGNVCMWKMELQ